MEDERYGTREAMESVLKPVLKPGAGGAGVGLVEDGDRRGAEQRAELVPRHVLIVWREGERGGGREGGGEGGREGGRARERERERERVRARS